jgi:hypothetical protein
MTLKRSLQDREQDKFASTSTGDTAIRTIPSSGQSVNPLAKFVERVLTSPAVETYNYYESNSKVTLYNSITVTYTDNTLSVLLSSEWS